MATENGTAPGRPATSAPAGPADLQPGDGLDQLDAVELAVAMELGLLRREVAELRTETAELLTLARALAGALADLPNMLTSSLAGAGPMGKLLGKMVGAPPPAVPPEDQPST